MIDQWLVDQSSAHHLPEPCAYALRLALEELFLNTVSYGCCNNVGTFIDLFFQIEDGHALIVIEDDAHPFNPLTAPVPCPEDPPKEREGGLGLLLARKMLTALDYVPLAKGNRLIIKKQLGQTPS